MMESPARFIPPQLLPTARVVHRAGRRLVGLLTDWVLPPGFIRVTRPIRFSIAHRPSRDEATLLARNARFKDIHAGKRCFVIGNGPSLNKQDLSPLADEITIAMNFFNKHPVIDKWKPTFFCMAEPRGDRTEEQLPLFLDRIDAQAYFYRMEYRELFNRHRWVDPDKVYYLKSSPIWCTDWPTRRRAIDLSQTTPPCQTTAHMALMLAVYLGCSPIYITGFDHDWLAHRSVATHFYESNANFDGFTYRQLIDITTRIWDGYEWIRDVASRQGTVIYNATDGGFLDVLERVDFNSLFTSGRAVGPQVGALDNIQRRE